MKSKQLVLCAAIALIAATSHAADCDGNGIDDAVEIQGNPLLDCDGDGILNVCEATSIANDDVLTVGYGLSADVTVTANDVVASSTPLTLDITSNPVQGFVQLLAGGVIRYNNSGPSLPRDCSSSTDIVRYRLRDCANNIISNIATLTVTVTHPIPDCNCNWAIDATEISNGDTLDSNGNSVPDECEGPPGPCRIALANPSNFDRQFEPDLSTDGRYLVYTTSGSTGAFVRLLDRQLGTTVQVAQSSTTSFGGTGERASVSDDGRFVTFQGSSTTLVPGDTNGVSDIFVRDRQLGSTRRISLTTTWAQANGASSTPAISGNGRWVVFRTFAANINGVAGQTRLWLFDLQAVQPANPLTPVLNTGAAAPNASSFSPAMSQDGRYVVFDSDATNLIPAASDTNAATDIFRFDRLGAAPNMIQRISVGAGGVQSNGSSAGASISADGRFVAFLSIGTNLVASDVGGLVDAFVRDTQSGTTLLASTSTSGQPDSLVSRTRIAASGTRVAICTAAGNWLPSGTNPSSISNVFVRDLTAGTTTLASVGDLGTPGNGSSGDEGFDVGPLGEVFLASRASNLVIVSGLQTRIYGRTCSPSIDPTVCVGDGSGTECPCGNNSAVGSNRGCLHSFGLGARLAGTGVSSVLADTVTITLSDAPASGGQATTFFQGTRLAGGGAGTVFGDGLRCAVGTVLRLGTRSAATGGASFGHGISGDPAISVVGVVPAAGSTRYYQATYRNALAFCTSATFNASNGIEIVWVP